MTKYHNCRKCKKSIPRDQWRYGTQRCQICANRFEKPKHSKPKSMSEAIELQRRLRRKQQADIVLDDKDYSKSDSASTTPSQYPQPATTRTD